EGDQAAAPAPVRGGSPATAEAGPPLVRAIGIPAIDLLVAGTVAFEHDLATVGRIRAADIDPRRIGQPLRSATARSRYAIDVGIAGDRHRIEDPAPIRSEEHTSELQSRENLVCRLLLETKKL